MRRTLARLAAVTLLLPPSLLAGGPAVAAAATTLVPYPIDSSNQAGWWSPLDTYGAGVDVLYLVDITNLRLYYGRN